MSTPYSSATIFADIDKPDRVLARLTARQLAILIPTAVIIWAVYLAAGRALPLPVFAALAIPVIGAATALALVERDGIGLDRLLAHAVKQAREPRHLTIAPDGVPALPTWATAPDELPPLPSPLRLPVRAIRCDGVINLGADGVAVLVACSTVSFALRTPGEQAALVAAFGSWLNSLTGPAQVLVHAQPINLSPAVSLLRERAAALPHPALEDAALSHADFLAELAHERDLLARQVIIVLRETYGPSSAGSPGGRRHDAAGAAMRGLRRGEQTVRALAAAGINAYLLDGAQTAAVLAAAADPTAPPMGSGMAAPDEPITARAAEDGAAAGTEARR